VIPETRAIRLLLVAFVLLTVVLAYSGAALVNATAPLGIVSLQLAGTGATAALILDSWGSDGLAAAWLNLIIDFPYLMTYGALLGLLCRRAARTRPLRVATGRSCLRAAVAAAAFDAVENLALLVQLQTGANDPAAALAFACAGIKFALLAIVIAYLVVTALIALVRLLR
jgi:hypothetical protein